MGTLVEKNTLRAMLLEILLKDKELSKDIFQVLLKADPQLLEELVSVPTQVGEPQVAYKIVEKDTQNSIKMESDDPDFPNLEDLTPERKKWLEERISKDFTKYDDVFKALA